MNLYDKHSKFAIDAHVLMCCSCQDIQTMYCESNPSLIPHHATSKPPNQSDKILAGSPTNRRQAKDRE
jgi:hypothetical protein